MTGRDRQTVADMAVEHCGSSEAVFAIARCNGISIDAEVTGMELSDQTVRDSRTRNYIAGTGVSPAGTYRAADDVLTTDNGAETVVSESDETIVQ